MSIYSDKLAHDVMSQSELITTTLQTPNGWETLIKH